jgi:serine/threonine protein kinase, bacterial
MIPPLLNDRYRAMRVLGAGSFGETFLAEDTQMPSKRHCVIKQLKPIANNPAVFRLVQERFEREAAILEELGGTSDRIPTLYAYFQTAGQFYLVQELIEGETIRSRLQQIGILSESTVYEILVNLLPVLEYVHSKKIIHRDIKPDNIMLRQSDGQPVLIDFGAVRELMGTELEVAGSSASSIVIGTRGYMPSEQVAGRPVYSSDLYSLGMTAIHLLTGVHPLEIAADFHTGESVWHQHAVGVSSKMKAVIDRAVKYHPRDRYPAARDMLNDLQSDGVGTTPTISVVKTPPPLPETLLLSSSRVVAGGNQKGLRTVALVLGGLIGSAAILSLVITNSSKPTVQPTSAATVATNLSSASSVPSSPAPTSSPVQNTAAQDYYWLSQRSVINADLDDKNGLELDIMRNWIFAVHGRSFETPGLQEYFNKQSWYRSMYSPQGFPSNLLSSLELQNINFISNYQDRYNRRYFKK